MPNRCLFLAAFLLIQTASVWADPLPELRSPIPPSIEGMTIPNSHYVDSKIVRGQTPLSRNEKLKNSQFDDLKTLGITDVLIFKNPVEPQGDKLSDNDREIVELRSRRFTKDQIHQEDFLWKNIKDYGIACQQVVDSLNLMRRVQLSPDRKLYFHCTVGEDRTGLLAGLYRVAYQDLSPVDAFKNEMCARGYEAGDFSKDDVVVQLVRDNLTPLYVAMARLLSSSSLDKSQPLPDSLCDDKTLNVEEHQSYDRAVFTCKRP